MRRFDMYVPANFDDLLAYLDEHPISNEIHLIANGSDIINRIQRRQLRARTLVDLSGLGELNYVKKENGTIRVGALTSISDLVGSPIIDSRLEVFREVASKFGGPAIRNVATVGGNICAASSSEDLLPVLLILDAKVRLRSKGNERVIPIEEFLRGKRQTDLKPNEILVETMFEEVGNRSACAFEKIGMRNSLIIAFVNCAVYLRVDESSRIEEIRIAFNRVAGKIPARARKTEEQLKGTTITTSNVSRLESVIRDELRTSPDFRASAEYRSDVACVLLKRAMNKCIHELEGR
ncbi:MAG: FAD binding domain-containing protein [Candidatus Bathyarchaeia archaeon]